MTKKELHKLIGRYFDADTTIEEERLLRRMLASVPPGDPIADEAKAVMGFSLCAPGHDAKEKHKTAPRSAIAWINVAASIAVVLAAGIFTLRYNSGKSPDTIYACVDGLEITDDNEVLRMMQAELSDISEASEEMNGNIDAELAAIQEAFNEIDP